MVGKGGGGAVTPTPTIPPFRWYSWPFMQRRLSTIMRRRLCTIMQRRISTIMRSPRCTIMRRPRCTIMLRRLRIDLLVSLCIFDLGHLVSCPICVKRVPLYSWSPFKWSGKSTVALVTLANWEWFKDWDSKVRLEAKFLAPTGGYSRLWHRWSYRPASLCSLAGRSIGSSPVRD